MPRPDRWRFAAALLGLTILPRPVRAQGEWVQIGMRTVDFRVDHDVIRAAAQGRFRRLRFVVDGGDLELFNLRIAFGDGAIFSPATRLSFAQGARSRVIDLPGAERVIRRIDFLYRSVAGGGRGKATVRVYGRR